MGWSERQTAMLAEMGIRLWAPRSVRARTLAGAGASSVVPVDAIAGLVAPVEATADAVASYGAEAAAVASFGPEAAAVASALPSPVRPTIDPARFDRNAETRPVLFDGSALREAASACVACGLSAHRTRAVFGGGHPRAHWMFVGEAPGDAEHRLGQPFAAGPAGQLLDNLLRAVGLSRITPTGETDGTAGADPARHAYVAHVLVCQPPGNRNPSAAELRQCENWLLRQIEQVRPRVIVAMGRLAVASLLHSDEPIGRLRGRLHDCHGVPLVVTHEPSYLLRQRQDKARVWEDLCLAADAVEAAARLAPADVALKGSPG